jgi:hypothetical protein
MIDRDNLQSRVQKLSLELSGQPPLMCTDVGYLINDLWNEVLRLREENENLADQCVGLAAAVNSLQQDVYSLLSQGDGT